VASNRAIATAAVLSIALHVALVLALRAPESASERTGTLPDLRLSIENPAERNVSHDEVGAVRQLAAQANPRGIVEKEPRSHRRPTGDAASGPDVSAPLIEGPLPDTRIEAVAPPLETPEVVATIADGVRTIPVRERQMLTDHVKEWSQSFEDADRRSSHMTWSDHGHRYTADFQRIPATGDMDIERVVVEVTTEEDGQLLKSRMQMKRLAFSHFTQLVDRWDREVQLHDDEVIGRFHSNTELVVGWDRKTTPRFLGEVTTAAHRFVIANAGSARAGRDIFRGGLETDVQPIALPGYRRVFDGARPGTSARTVSLERDTRILFYADGSAGYRASEFEEPETRIAIGDSPLYLLGAPKARLFVQGVVHGTVLVHSFEDIVITGSLTYLGQREATQDSADCLGLAADRDIVIAEQEVTGPGDLRVDAAIYARRRFVVRDLNRGGPATLDIYGSLSAGTIAATEPRYATRVAYDPRFERVRPPGFPMTDRYELEAWDGQWEAAQGESDR
jgi:hypothetical protein